ncbi:response regulator [Candidatus Parabeggiatoa sp. HSG14]|uniref:response regulator n=1 Tax=Candidatus Parabeggiatoa sp. HSG14 TaxID=3055593 RepID=UPI0025A6DAF0|nr:response regulator [Thiotrichales bacterium HSG14]
MNFFNNLKVGQKIIASNIVTLILLVVIVVVLLSSLSTLTKSFIFLIEHDQPVLSNVYQLEKLVIDMETGQRGFLITGKDEFLEPYHNGLNKFDALLETEKKLVSDNPPQITILEKIGQLHNEWLEKAGKPEIEARREMNANQTTINNISATIRAGTGKSILDTMRTQFNAFTQTENQLNAQRAEAAKQKIVQLEILSLSLTLGAVVIGLLSGFFISRSIAHPLAKLTNMANKMAIGDMSQIVNTQNGDEMRQITKRLDEMGNIGRAFDALALSFKKMIEDIVQVSQELAKGNLRITPKTTYQGDFIQIKNALNTTLSNQSQVVEDIIKVSQGLAAGDLRVMPKAKYQGDFAQIKTALETSLSDLDKVIKDIVQVSQGLAKGISITAKTEYQGDFIQIKNALEIAATQLAEMSTKNKVQDWLKTGQTQLNEQITGEQEIATVIKKIISFLTTYVDAQVGLFYKLQADEDQPYLQLVASYAYIENDSLPNKYSLNEGLVGQSAMDRQVISVTQTPDECPAIIRSGLSAASPQHILLLPFLYEGTVKGVIEIGSTNLMTETQRDFLEQVMPNIGIILNMAESRTQMQALLKQSQQQAKELKIKQDELQQNNAKLQEQAEELQRQSEELETQQEELRQTNEALEIRAKDFERQQIDFQNKISTLEQTKREVEKAKAAVESKAQAQEFVLATHQQPDVIALPEEEITPIPTQPKEEVIPISDDRNALQPGDTSLLVIEDDRKFSSIILELSHKKGFKCIIAEDGFCGLQMAEKYEPNAIILDIGLPKLDGLSVMEKLKGNSKLRHIPVHFMSAADEKIDAKKLGAIGYLIKPVTLEQLEEALKSVEQFWHKTVKRLLIVSDNKSHQQDIIRLVTEEVKVAVATDNVCEQVQTVDYDCIVLDMDTDSGKQLLTKMLEIDSCKIFVIVYTERSLTSEEDALLLQYANEFPIKLAHSPERLLDEITLFLHQAEKNLPATKRDMLHKVRDNQNILQNRKVLVIDDDIRNSYALAIVLEEYDVEIIFAESGETGVEKLAEHDDIDVVLIDIIMQDMDGYETIQAIRKQAKYRQLPIIAIITKTERGEKAKCIEAGASDYLPKPIDSEKLLSVMRMWLYR